jgi:hypothetical protein
MALCLNKQLLSSPICSLSAFSLMAETTVMQNITKSAVSNFAGGKKRFNSGAYEDGRQRSGRSAEPGLRTHKGKATGLAVTHTDQRG